MDIHSHQVLRTHHFFLIRWLAIQVSDALYMSSVFSGHFQSIRSQKTCPALRPGPDRSIKPLGDGTIPNGFFRDELTRNPTWNPRSVKDAVLRMKRQLILTFPTVHLSSMMGPCNWHWLDDSKHAPPKTCLWWSCKWLSAERFRIPEAAPVDPTVAVDTAKGGMSMKTFTKIMRSQTYYATVFGHLSNGMASNSKDNLHLQETSSKDNIMTDFWVFPKAERVTQLGFWSNSVGDWFPVTQLECLLDLVTFSHSQLVAGPIWVRSHLDLAERSAKKTEPNVWFMFFFFFFLPGRMQPPLLEIFATKETLASHRSTIPATRATTAVAWAFWVYSQEHLLGAKKINKQNGHVYSNPMEFANFLVIFCQSHIMLKWPPAVFFWRPRRGTMGPAMPKGCGGGIREAQHALLLADWCCQCPSTPS